MAGIGYSIKGIQEMQAANQQWIAALSPSGVRGEAIRYVLTGMHRLVVVNTPVDTGSLRAAQRMRFDNNTGTVYIDPYAVNPKSGTKPVVYGPCLQRLGGDYDFYTRSFREGAPVLGRQALAMIKKGL